MTALPQDRRLRWGIAAVALASFMCSCLATVALALACRSRVAPDPAASLAALLVLLAGVLAGLWWISPRRPALSLMLATALVLLMPVPLALRGALALPMVLAVHACRSACRHEAEKLEAAVRRRMLALAAATRAVYASAR